MIRAVLLLTLLLGGCGMLPQPFRHEDSAGNLNPLLKLDSSAGVIVMPASGVTPTQGKTIARAMALAMQNAEIPATVGETDGQLPANRMVIFSQVSTQTSEKGMMRIVTDWIVRRPQGGELARQRVTVEEMDPRRWRMGAMADMFELAGESPAYFAEVLSQDPGPPGEKPVAPVVLILPMEDVPGDGGRSLPASLGLVLQQAGVTLARGGAESPHDYALKGAVTISPNDEVTENVKILWVVSRADGAELGQVELENPVAKGALTGPWGMVANDIAYGSATGIAEIINRDRAAP